MGSIQSHIFRLLQQYGPMSMLAIYDVINQGQKNKRYIRNTLNKLIENGMLEFDGWKYSIITDKPDKQLMKRGYAWVRDGE